MPFTRPTLAEVDAQIQSDISSRLPGAFTLLRRSILRVLARAVSGVAHLLYGNIEFNKDQLFVTSADEEYLSLHGGEYGIPQTAATKAIGQVIISGTEGYTVPILSELESATGEVYLLDALAEISGGIATVAVTAKVAGVDGNQDGGAALSFVSPIPGIDTTATVGDEGISGGTDIETPDSYRTRILERKRRAPHGGADFDYEDWMKSIPGVTRAWAIPLYQGIGTIGCAFVRDNDEDLIPSSSEIETVRDYIISHEDPITGKTIGIPVTAEPGLYMIVLSKLSVNLTVYIYPNTAAVRLEVESLVAELIKQSGGPNQAIYNSEISEVISAVAEERRHRLEQPSGLDYITASADQVHVPGTITFLDYNG